MDIHCDQLTGITDTSGIVLHHGALARLNEARGVWLHVETGSVWVTHDRCADDVLLQAGETYAIEHDGATVISPLGRRSAIVNLEQSSEVEPMLAERVRKISSAFRTMRPHAHMTRH